MGVSVLRRLRRLHGYSLKRRIIPHSLRAGILRRVLRHRLGLIGFILVIILVVMAIAPGLFTSWSPVQGDQAQGLLAPGQATPDGVHWMGTDPLGRDIWARVVYGARISLGTAALVTLLAAALGFFVGLLAGSTGGVIDSILMRLADIQLAFPALLLAIALVALLGPGLQNVVPTLIVLGWAQYARIIRGVVLSLREREYVIASRALGARSSHILFRHLAPNALPTCLVLASLHFGRIIIIESSLSFLGLGALPPTPTWGGMLADGRNYMFVAWWMTTFPGLAIFTATLGVNLLGEALREILDPRLSRSL